MRAASAQSLKMARGAAVSPGKASLLYIYRGPAVFPWKHRTACGSASGHVWLPQPQALHPHVYDFYLPRRAEATGSPVDWPAAGERPQTRFGKLLTLPSINYPGITNKNPKLSQVISRFYDFFGPAPAYFAPARQAIPGDCPRFSNFIALQHFLGLRAGPAKHAPAPCYRPCSKARQGRRHSTKKLQMLANS